jgi:hypothetical protein
MLDPKVTILQTTERAAFDDQNQPVIQLRITWRYGARHGPFYEYMPKEGWTVDAFAERIAGHVRQLALLPE